MPLIKLTSPLFIKKLKPTFENQQFAVENEASPKTERKYKSTPKNIDDNIDSKKGKIKTKRKSRNKLYLTDDDSFNEMKDRSYKIGENLSLSLSIARPQKPDKSGVSKVVNKKNKKKNHYKTNRKTLETQLIKEKEPPSEVQLRGAISIQDLSDLTQISHEEIIKFLFLQGTIVNINQIVDLETATLVLNNFDIKINNNIEKEESDIKITQQIHPKDNQLLKTRAPIVTIMGHVDHGKTSLLDAIKRSGNKITDSEAGGITQTIGTYEIDVRHDSLEKSVIFLDTPGHEAFMAMRQRGAKLADIAILIIAGDDSIKPQTEEAIRYIKESDLQLIVAITKIDKESVNPDSIKEQLAERSIIAEDWGGDTFVVPVSSVSGKNIDLLIDNIMTLAALQNLKADYEKQAEGTVIESCIDKNQGHVATIIVQEGQLSVGDNIACGNVFGRIRSITNQAKGKKKLTKCGPSSVVQISGLSGIANIGERFSIVPSEKEAKKIVAQFNEKNSDNQQTRNNFVPLEYGINTANKKIQVILKTNNQGSLESLLYSIKNIPQEKIQVELLGASAGEITENDINLAISTGSIILAFDVNTNPGAKNIASKNKLKINNYTVIYDLVEDLENKMIAMLEPEYLENEIGSGEIKTTFNLSRGVIAGCYVISGKLKKDSFVKVYQQDKTVYSGNLDSIKKVKEDVLEIEAKQECGLFIENFQDWESGNIVKSFELIEQKQKL
nr:InfB [Erythrotrichia foliiformis]